HPSRTSVDRAVLEAARKTLSPAEIQSRFETWLPTPTLDRGSVVRFKEGRVTELHGTSQARRFKLLEEADAVLTISGKAHTRSLLELALATGKPALPICFTGGDSRTMWRRNGKDFQQLLRTEANALARFEVEPTSARGCAALAKLAGKTLLDAA